MKLFIAFFLIPALSFAQEKVESKAYNWNDANPVKDENRVRRQYLDGRTTLLANLEIHTSTVEGGEAPHPPHTHTDQEELVIIKEGTLTATIGDKTKVLGPGGVVYVLPGEEHGFRNAGNVPCTYFIIKFKPRAVAPFDKTAASSFMVDWKELQFKPHDKGGRRDVVDRETKLFDRFEMHVTTLNAGLSSHAPHTHFPEEIILMKEGEAEMTVGNKKVKVTEGGLVFLDSTISHNLTNVGKAPATYFAFQWN